MKLKSLLAAVMVFAFASTAMAATAPAGKKHLHKKVHVVKKHHKVKHKKAAAV